MTVSPDHIRAQLDRLLTSEAFTNAPRMSAFLSYIVESSLAGEADKLKGYSIGVDVFKRAEDFDPQLDSIVRVQAGRLRKMLKLHYLTNGKNDPVHIDLPKGGYAPVFSEKNDVENMSGSASIDPPAFTEEADKPDNITPQRKRKLQLFWPIIIAGFSLFAFLFLVISKPFENKQNFKQALQLPEGPSVQVHLFEIPQRREAKSSEIDIQSLRSGLQYALTDNLSHFKDLMVISVAQNNSRDNDTNSQSPDYILTGVIQTAENRILVTSRLAEADGGAVLWSRTYNEPLETSGGMFKIQGTIAADVAAALGQPYSVINRDYSKRLGANQGFDIEAYLCLGRFYSYTDQKSSREHKDIRACLENAVTAHPKFSSGWAALSWIYGDEIRNNYNLRHQDGPPKTRALQAAQKAVKADPENAMAHQYLALARFMNEDILGFRSSAERALQLNPNDTEILADTGSHLIQLDNSDIGRQMVEKALRLNPGHPAWYHGSIIMYFYTRNETEAALFHARHYSDDASLQSQLLLTVCLIQDEQIEAAQRQFDKLIRLYPDFSQTYNARLDNIQLPKGMKEQVLQDLAIIGLGML